MSKPLLFTSLLVSFPLSSMLALLKQILAGEVIFEHHVVIQISKDFTFWFCVRSVRGTNSCIQALGLS